MTRDLRPLFDPSSVAVVGASDDPVKWGYGLARGALRGAHPHSCTRRSSVRREMPIIAAMSGTGVRVNS